MSSTDFFPEGRKKRKEYQVISKEEKYIPQVIFFNNGKKPKPKPKYLPYLI